MVICVRIVEQVKILLKMKFVCEYARTVVLVPEISLVASQRLDTGILSALHALHAL